jgi:cytochrome b561
VIVSLGWAIPGTARETESCDLLLLFHRSIGLLILALMLVRGVWRWRHPPPLLPPSLMRIEILAAHATHWLLYALFVLMPLSGYIRATAAGHSVNFFGLVEIPPLLPENDRISQAAIAVHLATQFLIYTFVALHVGGALMHWIVRRDGVFERMLPLRSR